MKISNLELEEFAEHKQFSAQIGFQSLWFRIPREFEPDPEDATPFLVSALVPAMMLGEDIHVDPSCFVSEKLLSNLPAVQDIYSSWNPIFKRISVFAEAGRSAQGKETGSFLSGGVDGTYTLCKHADTIDRLVLINGFDFSMGNSTWRAMLDRTEKTARMFGKSLIPIETNNKVFTLNYGLGRVSNFGSCLASISQILGFEHALISSGYTYTYMNPEGSHPLLDSLWETEGLKITHCGLEADRFRKIDFIAQYPEALANIWVCWKDPRYNCGECSKCYRTFIALMLSGVEDGLEFKKPIKIEDLKNLKVKSGHDVIFKEFWDEAKRKDAQQVKKILDSILGKHSLKTLIKTLDQHFLNGAIERIRFRGRDPSSDTVKITLSPRYSDEIVREEVAKYQSESDITENRATIGSIFFHDPELDADTMSETAESTER